MFQCTSHVENDNQWEVCGFLKTRFFFLFLTFRTFDLTHAYFPKTQRDYLTDTLAHEHEAWLRNHTALLNDAAQLAPPQCSESAMKAWTQSIARSLTSLAALNDKCVVKLREAAENADMEAMSVVRQLQLDLVQQKVGKTN